MVVALLFLEACGTADQRLVCHAPVQARCGPVLTCTAERVVEVECFPGDQPPQLLCTDPGACL